MNIYVIFVAIMVAAGAIIGAVLTARPDLFYFNLMPFVSVLATMGVVELLIMSTGRLQGPMPLNVRFLALGLGLAAYFLVSHGPSLLTR
jgi:hypothetical protein